VNFHDFACIGRRNAFRLLRWVAPLVFSERRYLKVRAFANSVRHHEPTGLKLAKQLDHVAVVVREQFGLDPQRAAFKTALRVGERPQASE
jgi:hypothetical protein